jgi:uncharacterized protein YjbI with pentapeptide repeats
MGLKSTKSIVHGSKRVSEILEAHERFFSGKDGGVRADLTGANLRRRRPTEANFSGAVLGGANLEGADLRRAKLTHAALLQAGAKPTSATQI